MRIGGTTKIYTFHAPLSSSLLWVAHCASRQSTQQSRPLLLHERDLLKHEAECERCEWFHSENMQLTVHWTSALRGVWGRFWEWWLLKFLCPRVCWSLRAAVMPFLVTLELWLEFSAILNGAAVLCGDWLEVWDRLRNLKTRGSWKEERGILGGVQGSSALEALKFWMGRLSRCSLRDYIIEVYKSEDLHRCLLLVIYVNHRRWRRRYV